jgi:hypothetical protein
MHTTGAFGISATPGTIATPCPRPRKNPLSAQGRRRQRPSVPRETAIFAQSAQNPPPPSLAGFHVKRRPAHAATRPRSLGVAHAISPDARLATGHDGRRTAVQFGLDGRRPPVQRVGTAVGGRRCSVRARRWEDSAAAWGHGRERTALQRVGTVAGGRRCRWWRMPVAGKPEARAEGIRFVAREATRIPSPHGSGFPATGHGGRRPPLQFGHDGRRTALECGHGGGRTALEFGHGGGRTALQRVGTVAGGRRCRRWRMPVAGKPEARAEGIRCVAREATRIPSPQGSGLPAAGHERWARRDVLTAGVSRETWRPGGKSPRSLQRQRGSARRVGGRPCSPGCASSRPSGHTLAVPATAQAKTDRMSVFCVKISSGSTRA